eukprot:4642648-Prymnesium_polylepis.1
MRTDGALPTLLHRRAHAAVRLCDLRRGYVTGHFPVNFPVIMKSLEKAARSRKTRKIDAATGCQPGRGEHHDGERMTRTLISSPLGSRRLHNH